MIETRNVSKVQTPALDTVRMLQQYGTVPVDFVAHILKRHQTKNRALLELLQVRGIVKIEGDVVTLTEEKDL